MNTTWSGSTTLPAWERTLVVVAHPDDESFGLGAIIDTFVRAGSAVHVLCLTRGEASTLGGENEDLGGVRRRELQQAGAALGVAHAELLTFPDGGLANVPETELADVVRRALRDHRPAGLLVFDPDGITGHPDHQTATRIATKVATEAGLPVLAWSLPREVADQVNAELGTGFAGHAPDELDIALPCDRTTQRVAVLAHATQAVPGSPLWRRLELLGDTEWLRWLAHEAR